MTSVNDRRDVSSPQLDVAERDPKSLILVIADMARSDPPMTSAFVAERWQSRRARLFAATRVRMLVAVPVALLVPLLIHYIFYSGLRVALPWGVLVEYAW